MIPDETLRECGTKQRPAAFTRGRGDGPSAVSAEQLGSPWQPAVVLLAAAAAGIAADRWLPLPLAAYLLCSVVALGIWGIVLRDRRRVLALAPLLAAIVLLGAAGHHAHWRCYPVDELGRSASLTAQPVAVELVAVSLPNRLATADDGPAWVSQTVWAFTARAERVRDGLDWRNCSGNIRVTIAAERFETAPGDRFRAFGMLSAPTPATNPGGFDRAAHARADRCLCRLHLDSPACLIALDRGSTFLVQRAISRLQAACRAQLAATIVPEQLPLAEALLLGRREELDDSLRDAFLTTGTIHLLCVSGLHVGLLAAALGLLLLRMPGVRRHYRWILAAAAGAYVLLVGAQPPVIRAAIMLWVAMAAGAVGRKPLSANTWAVAGLIVLALNPADLFRTGTQLSFLCAACLAAAVGSVRRGPADQIIGDANFIGPRLVRHFAQWVVRSSQVNGRLWLLSAPLVLARFNILSLLPILLNLLLIPPAAAALCLGAAAMLLGGVPWVGPALGAAAGAMLALIEATVDAAARLPGGHWWLPGPAAWWLLGFYAAAACFWAWPGGFSRRRRFALLALWTIVGLGASWWTKPRDEVRCTIIAVGHGCSVLIESPDGRTMLYDAGGLSDPKSVARQIAGVLWHRGITHLDAIVLSHADSDHFNAVPELLRKFSVGIVYASPAMLGRDRIAWHSDPADGERTESALQSLMAALQAHRVPAQIIAAGDRLILSADGRAVMEVLHPPKRSALGDDNVNSLVAAATFDGRSLLLTGDLEKGGLLDLLAEEPRDCDVILAPHHGSRQPRLNDLLVWSSPEWVVVSDSRNRPTPGDRGPLGDVVGATTLHTSRSGAIEVRLRTDRVQVSPFLPAARSCSQPAAR